MIGTLLGVLLILAVATRTTDGVRLRQQEVILHKLPTAEAAAFYQVLRRRAWKVRLLRLIALLSVFAIIYARRRLQPPPAESELRSPARALAPAASESPGVRAGPPTQPARNAP